MEDRITDSALDLVYTDGQVVLHTEMNQIISVFKTAINANFEDIQKIESGDTLAGAASKLVDASLSKSTDEELQESDTKVPTALQVKSYVDNLYNSLDTRISALES